MFLRKLAVSALMCFAIEAGAQNITAELTAQGFKHYSGKNYRAAADYFDQVVALEPNNDQIRYYLVYSLFFSGSKKAALRHAKILEKKSPKDQNYKILVAQITKDLESAKNTTSITAKTGTTPKEVMFGGYESATGELTLEKPKHDDSESYAPSKSEYSSRNSSKNENKSGSDKPKKQAKPKSKLDQAISYLDEERYSDAEVILNTLINEDRNNAEVWHQLGVSSYTQNDFESAIMRFTESLKNSKGSFQSLYLRAESYKRLAYDTSDNSKKQNLFSKAEKDYKAALKINENEKNKDNQIEAAYAKQNLAEVLLRQNKIDEAEKAYNELLEKEPTNSDAKAGLAQIKMEQGKMKEAKDLINSALSGNTEVCSELRYSRAYLLAESEEHNYSEAISELDQIPDLQSNEKYLTLKAKCMIKNYDVQGGLGLAVSLANANEDNYEALLILAEAYLYQDNLDDAWGRIERAEFIAGNGKLAEASLLKAKICERKENFEEAEKYYKDYMIKSPGQSRPYFEIGKFLKSRNRIDEAKSMYKQVIKEFPNSEVAENAQQELNTMN